MEASVRGYTDIVRKLLSGGAQVDLQDEVRCNIINFLLLNHFTLPMPHYTLTRKERHKEKQSYRIALNFRGSKFLRIVTFEDFVEIIS